MNIGPYVAVMDRDQPDQYIVLMAWNERAGHHEIRRILATYHCLAEAVKSAEFYADLLKVHLDDGSRTDLRA